MKLVPYLKELANKAMRPAEYRHVQQPRRTNDGGHGVRPARPEQKDATDAEYFTSGFDCVRAVREHGLATARRIVEEGCVLLKNDGGALPLARGSKVSLFGTASVEPVYTGSGSSTFEPHDAVPFKDGFEREGNLQVNPGLWEWYSDNLDTYGRLSSKELGTATRFKARDASWDEIATSAKTDRRYGDAAIFILARRAGESCDLHAAGAKRDGVDKDVPAHVDDLVLTPDEADVLAHLAAEKKRGTFDRVIVVMNAANQVQCDFVDDPRFGIDALIWVGDIGQVGSLALANVLVGTVSPSGRLADTFWRRHDQNPVYANWGGTRYTGAVAGMDGPDSNHNKYLVYQEGIYNGYRYTETRYEDVVLGRDGAGLFDYAAAVAYPFGFGLSYTTFSYRDFAVAYDEVEDCYWVTVLVTNTGGAAAREVVQLYLQKPYTEHDVRVGMEKAAVELVAFAKTRLLAPGESQTVCMRVPRRVFASYDAAGASTYVVEAGSHYLTVARDAHDAVNNILAAKGKTERDGMTGTGDTALVAVIEQESFDDVSYATSVTGACITNRFDDVDINRYKGRGANSVRYFSRSDWEGTLPEARHSSGFAADQGVTLCATADMTRDMCPELERDDEAYPAFGSTRTSWKLIDLRENGDGAARPYDDPLWEELLDQLSWDDYTELLSNGRWSTRALPSIAKPQTIDHNGSIGPVRPYNSFESANRGLAMRRNDPDRAMRPVLYPCTCLIASTFDTELAYMVGRAWGEDCLWAGHAGLYGPALNLHRGAHGGRAFEYYSEDPVLCGATVASLVWGVQEKGTYVYLKHAILNEQERFRHGISTWVCEQAVRELYLRPFQMAIEEGGARCVMTGFNRIGCVWMGNQGFIDTVLRGEFGMQGFAVTDWFEPWLRKGYMTLTYAITRGQDLPDGNVEQGDASHPEPGSFSAYRTGYGRLAWAMRESVHRILYTVVHSSAMNGMDGDTQVERVQITRAAVACASVLRVVQGVWKRLRR